MAESASKLAVSTACAESAPVSPATSVERHAAGACRAATGRITILKTIADVMKAIGGAVANCCHPFSVPSPGLSVEPQIAQVAVTGPGRPRASGLRIALYVSAGGRRVTRAERRPEPAGGAWWPSTPSCTTRGSGRLRRSGRGCRTAICRWGGCRGRRREECGGGRLPESAWPRSGRRCGRPE